MDSLLLKCMSSTFPECHYQLEETGFVTCRKKSLTLGQSCPLQSTMMTIFFCFQRKFSNTVTSEILCIGRKSQRSIWWPKPEMWPIELFSGNEVREILSPPKLDMLSLSTLLSVGDELKGETLIPVSCVLSYNQFAWFPSLRFQCIWRRSECMETILSYLHLSRRDRAPWERKQAFTWKSQQCYLELCLSPESFKELTCWVKWEFRVRFSVQWLELK